MNTDVRGQKLLIIDDEPINLHLAAEFLSAHGLLDISLAHSGAEGIEKAREIQPDLILLDILMPGMDGFETCHKLKQSEDTRDIPVLFLSALTDIDDKLKGFAVGGLDFITKPFEESELLARVGIHMANRKLQRELEDKNMRLNAALDTGHVVNVAIGVLMERHHMSRDEAFQAIRTKARSERRKAQSIAEELLTSLDTLNLWKESNHQ